MNGARSKREYNQLCKYGETSPSAARLVDALGDVRRVPLAELIERADVWRLGEATLASTDKGKARAHRQTGRPVAIVYTSRGGLAAIDLDIIANN